MIVKKSAELTPTENFRYIAGTYLPRPVYLVNTVSENGTVNMGPFSYCGFISTHPPMVSVSVLRKKDGTQKDTAINLLRTGEAVLHLANSENVVGIQTVSKTLPYGESELDLSGFTLTDSQMVDVPSINEASVRLETKVHKHIELPSTDLFILEIVAFVFEDNILNDEGKVDTFALDVMAKLYGKEYTGINEVVEISSRKI
ncbi:MULTISPECIES: flavin reductase family protein [unclassified Granulicatella]|uniref:flavin reductase family protein n=1 Tax=unclassified Granulicatella TaxID=2630493 RepID=UPI0010735175|nr:MULTISPECIES: flavin reductase family protein [unclassified Granulicatella]MBF0780494.1 flavin reductase family protein [Granulicatella sp. 19428wC4_WM01]TFU95353.1 flavin reductase family protein [Granulicatella sp. WM01]